MKLSGNAAYPPAPSLEAPGTLEIEGKTFLDGRASDPRALGWMQGSPPPAEKQVRFDSDSDTAFPKLRWALSHMRELSPTVGVWRGTGPSQSLGKPSSADAAAVDALTFTDTTGRVREFEEALFDSYTDGIMVLHRGRVVYERYLGALEAYLPHACFSMTKSYTGTLMASLVHEGVLDETKTVAHYVPELSGTAWNDATLRQTMDMRTGLSYSEDDDDESSGAWAYMRAGRTRPRPAGYDGPQTSSDYLLSVLKEGAHGGAFSYKSVNTQVMAWVLARVTGLSFAQLLHERLWGPLGCEDDAYLVVDPAGVPSASGGMSATLRDLARFGELMRREGDWGGKQLIPSSVVREIHGADLPARLESGAMSGYTYRNQWWVPQDEFGAIEAVGIHGQRLYITPGAETVIVRLASQPVAVYKHDPITDPMLHALVRLVRG
ncbi:serine hydrolase domain-containing protein [Arthrobacter sp. HMWF013]|uniref:serine hydrolase domain-containing protein n=1 Tax=Arthrobacter sp. HMWF013 TaxID=2056849 RepID=UPI001C62C601|nr:serine hydrolase [Arthrobacter sp. HMWF013]